MITFEAGLRHAPGAVYAKTRCALVTGLWDVSAIHAEPKSGKRVAPLWGGHVIGLMTNQSTGAGRSGVLSVFLPRPVLDRLLAPGEEGVFGKGAVSCG